MVKCPPVLLLLLTAQLAQAADIAGSQDHPMLSRFPGTEIVGYEQRTHDQAFLPSQPAFAAGDWVAGRMTWIAYRAPANVSTLQLYRNYEKALAEAGFVIGFACQKDQCGRSFIRQSINATNRRTANYERWMPDTGRYLAARLERESGIVWVSLLIYELNRDGETITRLEVVEQNDPRPFSELRGEQIGKKRTDYDEARIAAGQSDGSELSSVMDLEGKVEWTAFRYVADISPYEAFTSTAQHVRSRGYEVLFACGRTDCGRNFIRKVIDLNELIVDGGERWSQESGFYFLAKLDGADTSHLGFLTYRQPNGYAVSRSLSVSLENPEFDQIKVSAESMAEDLDKRGKVALYGIYFDTDKAELKTESRPTLDEIARLLELRSELQLYVDGHTDDQGDDDYNLELSKRRAASVVRSLIADYGVAASRLASRGFGESEPVEDNTSEEGRSLNRRVELVAR